jgi:hypothetical protein
MIYQEAADGCAGYLVKSTAADTRLLQHWPPALLLLVWTLLLLLLLLVTAAVTNMA